MREESVMKLRKVFIAANILVYGIELVYVIVSVVLENGEGFPRSLSFPGVLPLA